MDWIIVPWGAGNNHGGVHESGTMMGWSTLRKLWGSGYGTNPMMGWNQIISLGRDGLSKLG